MAAVCVEGGWREDGVDEGRDRRKQEEGKVARFSALQLLFSEIITLRPLTP